MHRHASFQFPDFKVERFLQLFLQAFHAVKAFLFLFFFYNLLLCLLFPVVDVFLLFPFWRPPGRRINDRMHLVYTACVCALCLLLLDFLTSSSSSRCANKKQRGVVFFDGGEKSLSVVVLFFCCSLQSKIKKTLQFLFFQKHIIYTQYTLSFCVLYPRETFFCLLSATLLLVYTRIKRCARCESLSFFLSFLSFTRVARKRLKRIFFKSRMWTTNSSFAFETRKRRARRDGK